MNTRKPEPLYTFAAAERMCPVCGKRSYSRAGVHPQCSVRLADAPRVAALAEEKRKSRLQAASAADKDDSHL